MSYLLDNNFVSEWLKPSPDPGAIAWLETTKTGSFSASSRLRKLGTVSSLWRAEGGVIGLMAGCGQTRHDRFSGRIIAIDDEIAFACVRLLAARQTMAIR